MAIPDIRDLVQRAQNGDKAAFSQLVSVCADGARSVAIRYLGRSTDVDDILQDAFSQAFVRLPDLDAPERFPEWLRVIVRNRCLSHLRRRGRDVVYSEAADLGDLQISELTITSTPEDEFLAGEQSRVLRSAIDRLSPPHRAVTTLHYLEGKPYSEIAQLLRVSISTIEGRLYRARKQLKEELLKMADIDHEALKRTIEAATKGLQDDIDGLKQQLWAVQREEDRWIEEARSAAARTITQLPTSSDNPITWGIVGGYRLEAGKDSRRIAISSMSSIDEFLDRVTDEGIASFCRLFGDPIAVAILRRLVFGKQAVKDIVAQAEVDESQISAAIDHLADAGLVSRDGDGNVEPLSDTVTHFLTLLSMSHLYGFDTGTPRYGDSLCRDIIVRAARDLSRDLPHPPPVNRLSELSQSARQITLMQAIPMSLSERQIADLKAGARLAASELNGAQLEYLRLMLEELGSSISDVSGVTLSIDPTHTGEDDHAHIVIERGEYSHHIDAFMQDTARAGWY
jgi:RNA polymerase sigma-70 factor, ECF subfamily